MPNYNRNGLITASNDTYITNSSGSITAANVRSLNIDWINSIAVLSGSNAFEVYGGTNTIQRFTAGGTLESTHTFGQSYTLGSGSNTISNQVVPLSKNAQIVVSNTDTSSLFGATGSVIHNPIVSGSQQIRQNGTTSRIDRYNSTGTEFQSKHQFGATYTLSSGSDSTSITLDPYNRLNSPFIRVRTATGSNAVQQEVVIGATGSYFDSPISASAGFTASLQQNYIWIGNSEGRNIAVSTGSINLQGPTGPQGIQGPQGTQGIQGVQGTQGLQGIQGNTGAASTVQGPQGTQGIQGIQGTQGIQGIQGVQGLNGAFAGQGIQGIQGTQGIQGIQGVQGVQGIQGIQGVQGLNGAFAGQGIQGIQGVQGIQGTTGAASTVQGPQGTQGIQGTTGAASTVQGPQGTQGIQGTTGAASTVQGPQGTQGVQGTTGAASTVQGPQGTQGVQGTTGADSTVQGPQGIQGTTGAASTVQGPQGTTGANAGILTYTSPANNRVITSVSSTEILAEPNLTFDGSTLAVTGAITATGDISAFQTSDRRLKDNIVPIEKALDKIRKLNGVKWEWNEAETDDVIKASPKTGLIAQEVREVLPEVVLERDNGYLAIDYSKMMGLIVEAIKELDKKIK